MQMAHSGRPAEAYATLVLTEGLATALPGVRTRPERGPTLRHASRAIDGQPELATLARARSPALQALHDAKRIASRRGADATSLDAFLAVVSAATTSPPAAPPASPTAPVSPATSQAPVSPPASSQSGVGEADIVFVLERAPSHSEHAALRTFMFETLLAADCRRAFVVPVPPSADAAPSGAPGSDPTTPPGQTTTCVGAAGLPGVLPSPERASGCANSTCYLLCEVTADARWLLHKLVQLELNARALALRALETGVGEALDILPCDVARVVAVVGVAAPLGLLSLQLAERVVKFIRAQLPFLAHMLSAGSLFFLGLGIEGHNTNVIVANLLLSHMALADDVAALKGDVAEIKGDVAAIKGRLDDIMTILRRLDA